MQKPQKSPTVWRPWALKYSKEWYAHRLERPAHKRAVLVAQARRGDASARGDLIVITEGLKGGEQIASSGIFKLRNGLAVQVNNSVQPGSNPAPKPGNT